MACTMLSSLTLHTPRKVARSATVIATHVLRRAFVRSSDADVCSAASPADSIGSRSIAGWPGILAGRHQEKAKRRAPGRVRRPPSESTGRRAPRPRPTRFDRADAVSQEPASRHKGRATIRAVDYARDRSTPSAARTGAASVAPRMILPLGVALQLRAIEVHVPKIARAVPFSLIAEMPGPGIAALAARRDRSGPHTVSELHHGHEAIPAGAVHLPGPCVRARAE